MIPFIPVKPIRGGRPLDDLYRQLAADPEWVCQAKMNGKRAIWDPSSKTLWSRTGNRVTPHQAKGVLETLRDCPVTLDGELITRRTTGEEIFWAFDLPDHRGTLRERWVELEGVLSGYDRTSFVELCPSSVHWEDVEQHGWEGVVFKRAASKYEKARVEGKETASWVKYRAEWL